VQKKVRHALFSKEAGLHRCTLDDKAIVRPATLSEWMFGYGRGLAGWCNNVG
jgi:hypothetical protein